MINLTTHTQKHDDLKFLALNSPPSMSPEQIIHQIITSMLQIQHAEESVIEYFIHELSTKGLNEETMELYNEIIERENRESESQIQENITLKQELEQERDALRPEIAEIEAEVDKLCADEIKHIVDDAVSDYQTIYDAVTRYMNDEQQKTDNQAINNIKQYITSDICNPQKNTV